MKSLFDNPHNKINAQFTFKKVTQQLVEKITIQYFKIQKSIGTYIINDYSIQDQQSVQYDCGFFEKYIILFEKVKLDKIQDCEIANNQISQHEFDKENTMTCNKNQIIAGDFFIPVYYLNLQNAHYQVLKQSNSLGILPKILGYTDNKRSASKFIFNKNGNTIVLQHDNNNSPNKNPCDSDQSFLSNLSLKALKKTQKKYCIKQFTQKKFLFSSKIGQGFTSDVYKVQKISDASKTYALKVINKDKLDPIIKKQIVDEIKILRKLSSCTQISKIYRVYENHSNVYLLLDYIPDGDLKQLIHGTNLKRLTPFPESEIRMILAQLLLSIDFMHKNNIIHRDIKPENILVTRNSKQSKSNIFNSASNAKQFVYRQEILQDSNSIIQVTLADFGFAVDLNQNTNDEAYDEDTVCGTPGYFSPEVLQGSKLDTKSDIFSLGCLIYKFVTGETLFEGGTIKDLLINNRKCNFAKNMNNKLSNFSPQLQILIRGLLTKDPKERPTAEQALQYPFFNQISRGLFQCLALNQLHSQISMKNTKQSNQNQKYPQISNSQFYQNVQQHTKQNRRINKKINYLRILRDSVMFETVHQQSLYQNKKDQSRIQKYQQNQGKLSQFASRHYQQQNCAIEDDQYIPESNELIKQRLLNPEYSPLKNEGFRKYSVITEQRQNLNSPHLNIKQNPLTPSASPDKHLRVDQCTNSRKIARKSRCIRISLQKFIQENSEYLKKDLQQRNEGKEINIIYSDFRKKDFNLSEIDDQVGINVFEVQRQPYTKYKCNIDCNQKQDQNVHNMNKSSFDQNGNDEEILFSSTELTMNQIQSDRLFCTDPKSGMAQRNIVTKARVFLDYNSQI
eukprot:403371289